MWPVWIGLAILGLALGGCGGPRPVPGSLLAEFQRYESEIQTLGPNEAAGELLHCGQAMRDEARPLIEKGDAERACPLLEMAVADARAALALVQADAAVQDADRCLRAAEQARRSLEEALRQLVETERVTGRSAWEKPREIPGMSGITLASLPPTASPPDGPPDVAAADLSGVWGAWRDAAAVHRVATTDLEIRFAFHLAASLDAETAPQDRQRHLHIAGRTLQELEARVRKEASQQVCVRAVLVTAGLGEARDTALRGTLELERGLKGELRTQLEDARVAAEARQNQLYKALHQLEGKFARISREARGTIISLSDILFDFDKATLKRDVEFHLVRVATILNQFPEMGILIEGHTDNIGAPEYNLDLSRHRAQAVHDFLVSQDVSAARMAVEGYGMARPVEDNSTEERRRRNRRVDLVIQDSP